MKILCITSSYPRFEGDYAGHFVAEFNDQLSQAGHTIKTLFWEDPAFPNLHFQGFEKCSSRGIRYAPRNFETLFFNAGGPQNLRQKRNKALVIPASIAMWRAIVKEEKPDLVIGHWALPGGLLARFAGDYFNIPSLIIGHSGGLHQLRKLNERSILKAIVLEGRITIPSRAFSDIAPNADFLPIGFHSQITTKNSMRSYQREGALIMSRLEPIKNIARVIRIWSGDLPTLHIAGDGTQRKTLENLARKHKNIVFHGFVSGKKKQDLLLKCRYFFLPSMILEGRHEGYPIALLQSIDAGLTPLVSHFPGVEDVLSPAFLVGKNESWLASFHRLQNSSPSLEGIQRRTRQRRWEVLGKRWIYYIEGLL